MTLTEGVHRFFTAAVCCARRGLDLGEVNGAVLRVVMNCVVLYSSVCRNRKDLNE